MCIRDSGGTVLCGWRAGRPVKMRIRRVAVLELVLGGVWRCVGLLGRRQGSFVWHSAGRNASIGWRAVLLLITVKWNRVVGCCDSRRVKLCAKRRVVEVVRAAIRRRRAARIRVFGVICVGRSAGRSCMIVGGFGLRIRAARGIRTWTRRLTPVIVAVVVKIRLGA